MILYVILFVITAILYPGGSYAELDNVTHYSFFHNFMCDTMDEITKSGQKNTARSVGIVAHLVLSFGMICFFYILPEVFSKVNRNTKFMRFFGMLSMVLFCFMFTELHDVLVVTTAVF